MSKRIILGLAALAVVGAGLWFAIDPDARLATAEAWNGVVTAMGRARLSVNANSLLQPVAGAFQDLADSVASLWSPKAIRIEVPSIQVPH